MTTKLVSRERVEEALEMLGKPGDIAEARVWAIARAYADGHLTIECGICGKAVNEAVCIPCYEENLDGG
jgi:hypothetical protein